jgi:hypothetical protein
MDAEEAPAMSVLVVFSRDRSIRFPRVLFTEMEFLDINLTKELSLLLRAIHSPLYWKI